MKSIEELMRTRRSIRRFRQESVPREVVTELVDAAITAPSAGNRQPWRFFVTDDRCLIGCLADEVQEAARELTSMAPGDSADAVASYVAHFSLFRSAPVLITVAFPEATTLSEILAESAPASLLASLEEVELLSSAMGAAMAIQNALLYAHSRGLGATCMTGPLLIEEKLRDAFGVPSSWKIAAVIPVGYPDEEPEAPLRKPAEKLMRWVLA